jgi:hypothetical protein
MHTAIAPHIFRTSIRQHNPLECSLPIGSNVRRGRRYVEAVVADAVIGCFLYHGYIHSGC